MTDEKTTPEVEEVAVVDATVEAKTEETAEVVSEEKVEA